LFGVEYPNVILETVGTALEVLKSCLIYSFMGIFGIKVFSAEFPSDRIYINHLKFMTLKISFLNLRIWSNT